LVDDPIVAAARSAHKAGLAVVPPKEDGTKRPDVGEWTAYQRRRPTSEELRAWFSPGRGGVGLVMGAVSGGLETIEFDDRATYERYIEIAQGTGLGDVVSRIRAGYEETTPGGGSTGRTAAPRSPAIRRWLGARQTIPNGCRC
jgi:putative DNA primase/helicase